MREKAIAIAGKERSRGNSSIKQRVMFQFDELALRESHLYFFRLEGGRVKKRNILDCFLRMQN